MKEFKDLFPSLETCKKFQEMGLFKESCFAWVVEDTIKPHERWSVPQNSILAPAPTTDEILAELPQCLNTNENEYYLYVRKNVNQYGVYYVDAEVSEFETLFDTEDFENDSLVQALAELYLKLKAEKII